MPQNDKERIRVEFLGETFTLKGNVDKEEVQKTSDCLNEQMELLKSRYPNLTAKGLAVLSAFHLANELLQARKDYEALVSLLDRH